MVLVVVVTASTDLTIDGRHFSPRRAALLEAHSFVDATEQREMENNSNMIFIFARYYAMRFDRCDGMMGSKQRQDVGAFIQSVVVLTTQLCLDFSPF